MANTTLIKSKKQFNEYKSTYWKDGAYTRYYVDEPTHFPCVAIEEFERGGDLGSIITINTFVYLEDFNDYEPVSEDST